MKNKITIIFYLFKVCFFFFKKRAEQFDTNIRRTRSHLTNQTGCQKGKYNNAMVTMQFVEN